MYFNSSMKRKMSNQLQIQSWPLSCISMKLVIPRKGHRDSHFMVSLSHPSLDIRVNNRHQLTPKRVHLQASNRNPNHSCVALSLKLITLVLSVNLTLIVFPRPQEVQILESHSYCQVFQANESALVLVITWSHVLTITLTHTNQIRKITTLALTLILTLISLAKHWT